MAGAAAECGIDAALSMVELDQFYDTIRIDHLLNAAWALVALARILRIDRLANLAFRAIQYLEAVSDLIGSIQEFTLCRSLASQTIGLAHCCITC